MPKDLLSTLRVIFDRDTLPGAAFYAVVFAVVASGSSQQRGKTSMVGSLFTLAKGEIK